MMKLTIGTRQSPLAMTQARLVAGLLRAAHPGLEIELLPITTKGDRILDVPLAQVGGKGLFVKEIEEALLQKRADLAVHSMKDVPAELPQGLTIAAVPAREDCRDVLVCRRAAGLGDLPDGARVGTGSLRRAAQLLHLRPDLNVVGLRGNLETRLKKLTEQDLDAVVLAAAGMSRQGLAERITEFLDPAEFLPAVGQGALGIETREDDDRTNEVVRVLDDPSTRVALTAERAFLKRLEGGCQVPLACLARLDDGRMIVDGLIAGLEGTPYLRDQKTGPTGQAAALGAALAEELLSRGGAEILRAVYGQGE
ncbi:MAG: hydroxymethylbilane synthase [Proteobacteria bacterium]|nr:hydroxymethylbilane synthase [Pseudomonadota bacterium]MBU1740474.1 hydroxymethylbilane synthase [Pseudomonadota bacterium]